MTAALPLRWQLRRSMRELDVLLGRYFEGGYASAGAAERDAFHALLREQDPDILAWLLQQATPPRHYADVLDRIRSRH